MGQTGIRAVMDRAVRPGLRKELESQLREYDTIEQEAHAIAAARSWELQELDPAAKTMAKLYARTHLTRRDADSKIAEMMIQGNTKGMIKSLRSQNNINNHDTRIQMLSKKLLDCELENIRQMQGYL